jgi:predicted Ser/Thr protein kinase
MGDSQIIPPLTEKQSLLVKAIDDHAEKHGAWPTVTDLVLDLGLELNDGQSIVRGIPNLFVRFAQKDVNEELACLTMAGLVQLPGNERILEAFLAFVRAAAKLFIHSPKEEKRIQKSEFFALLGSIPESTQRKLSLIMTEENAIWGGSAELPEGDWYKRAGIETLRFENVATLEQFVALRNRMWQKVPVAAEERVAFLQEICKRWQEDDKWPDPVGFIVGYRDRGDGLALLQDLPRGYYFEINPHHPRPEEVLRLTVDGVAATGTCDEELSAFVSIFNLARTFFLEKRGKESIAAPEIARRLNLPLRLVRRVGPLLQHEYDAGVYLSGGMDWNLTVSKDILKYPVLKTFKEFIDFRNHLKTEAYARPGNTPLAKPAAVESQKESPITTQSKAVTLSREELRKAALDAFFAAPGGKYLIRANVLGSPHSPGELERRLSRRFTQEDRVAAARALKELEDEGLLIATYRDMFQGGNDLILTDAGKLFAKEATHANITQPSLPAKPSSTEEDVPTRYVCLRCGVTAPKPFQIGPGDRALCPGCMKLVGSATVDLNAGMIGLLQVGMLFGRYSLQECLGSGGFGDVWKALDQKLGRYVALKFPKYQHGETLERLKREAQAAAKLEHSNIARIYTFEQDKGKEFIVMQYVEGWNLEVHQPSSPKDAIRICRDIANAIAFAHEQQVVHRDLKPANIVVDKKGTPFITDFGLALLAESSRRLTTTGFVGTLAYAAPEQIEGRKVDHRVDIFALGVILYELLTGKLPPRAVAGSNLILDSLPPDMPGVQSIVSKCIQPAPESRYARGDELAKALEAVIEWSSSARAEKQSD